VILICFLLTRRGQNIKRVREIENIFQVVLFATARSAVLLNWWAWHISITTKDATIPFQRF
jgi:hypothetical protein